MLVDISGHDFLADARFAEQDDRRVHGGDAVGQYHGCQGRFIADDELPLRKGRLNVFQLEAKALDGVGLFLYRFLEVVDFRQVADVGDDHKEFAVFVENRRAGDQGFLPRFEPLLQGDGPLRAGHDERA